MSPQRKSIATLVLALLAAGGNACTYGHQDAQSGPYQPLVFPGEARLGASALMVIDSNHMQVGDTLEHYDLHRERVRILFVDDNEETVPVTLRSVFAVESGRATPDAAARPNAWTMAALFDLPDEFNVVFEGQYPKHARLLLEIDGVVVPELEGVIWITGTGGTPTEMGAAGVLLEQALEPRTMVRLRARDSGTGFETSWNIGAITAEIRYDHTCLQNPRVHVGSDAIGAGAFLSTPTDAGGGLDSVRLYLTHPDGFSLVQATTADPTRLGHGPILDVVFDRPQLPACDDTLDQYFQIHHLVVAELDGTLLHSQRGVVPALSDSSPYFHLHYVDPERPE